MDVFVEEKIDHLKPVMKLLKEITEIQIIPDVTVIQAKCDGEFNLIRYDKNGETYSLNRWGRKRTELPALKELKQALEQLSISRAELLAELYAKEDEKPLKLPDFIHHVKSGNPELLNKIHIGVWDILTIDGKPVKENYLWKYDEASSWFKNCKLVGVLPYHQPKNHAEIKTFWDVYVAKHGYEGLVIRNNSDIFKLKQKGDIDAVVIAINKKSGYGKNLNLFQQQMVTSLHLAIMDEQGNYIEIGDCASGINHQLRKALWKLINYKIAEDSQHVWIKPFLICQIEYTELFPSKNKIYTYTPENGYTQKGETNLIRLRHPRLICFRTDKQPTPQDIGKQQIPTKYLMRDENG